MEAKKNNGPQRRSMPFQFRMETGEDGTRTINGHGAVFGVWSENLGGFREMIHPGAFDEALANSDCRCLFNHDPNYPLGRTSSGTLRLSIDGKGLAYACDLPDNANGQNLSVSIDRGDITQSSFAFTLDYLDERTQDNPEGAFEWRFLDGAWEHHIYRVKELFDVAPVTYPAYKEADVRSAVNSLERAKEMRQRAIDEKEKVEQQVASSIESDHDYVSLVLMGREIDNI